MRVARGSQKGCEGKENEGSSGDRVERRGDFRLRAEREKEIAKERRKLFEHVV